jgi:hypothetical protein
MSNITIFIHTVSFYLELFLSSIQIFWTVGCNFPGYRNNNLKRVIYLQTLPTQHVVPI